MAIVHSKQSQSALPTRQIPESILDLLNLWKVKDDILVFCLLLTGEPLKRPFMKSPLIFLLILPLAAQVKISPLARIETDTKEGLFYQFEYQETSRWTPLGEPFMGTGKKITKDFAIPTDSQVRLKQLKDQWVLVWADDFDGSSLDRSKWANEENGYGGGNNERQFYSTEPKYTVVKDGLLNLHLFREPHTTTDGKTQPYKSSRLRSLYRGDWKYGRFEIRAKLPSGEGIWPAVWMLPTNSPYGTWAAGGEIDIIESRGSEVEKTIGTLHFGGKWPNNQYKGGSYRFPDKNASEDFHLYAVEWERDEIRWFVDGIEWQKITKDQWHSASAPQSPTAPFDQPFHLIINLAADGHFFSGGDPNHRQSTDNLKDDAFPQTMQIDYVKVYQWAR